MLSVNNTSKIQSTIFVLGIAILMSLVMVKAFGFKPERLDNKGVRVVPQTDSLSIPYHYAYLTEEQ
jgi:hypothetical protein